MAISFLQYVNTCAPSASQKREVKGTQTLISLENGSPLFFFFLPKTLTTHKLMKELLFYPHQFSTLKTKLAGKSRAMQALDIFALLQV